MNCWPKDRTIQILAALILSVGVVPSIAHAGLFEWSKTELFVRYGTLDEPSFAGGGNATHKKLTIQHADQWKYGDNFFFVDFISGSSDFNNSEIYGEFYTNLSLQKLRGADPWEGPIKDIGLNFGFNFADDAKVRKYLPGIRFDLNLPKFQFSNLLISAYIDGNRGVRHGGAPKEDDSFLIDFSWARPFSIGEHDFSIEGHIEYAGERENEFGDDVSWHILGQPQLRYDLGKTLFQKPQHLFVGVEAQFWINKLGDAKTDEFAPQVLIVWRF